jgi:hypothetical protein
VDPSACRAAEGGAGAEQVTRLFPIFRTAALRIVDAADGSGRRGQFIETIPCGMDKLLSVLFRGAGRMRIIGVRSSYLP